MIKRTYNHDKNKNIQFSFVYFIASTLIVIASLILFPLFSEYLSMRDIFSSKILVAGSVCLSIFSLKNLLASYNKLKKVESSHKVIFIICILGNICFFAGSIFNNYVPNKLYESYYLLSIGSCCFILQYSWEGVRIVKQKPNLKVLKIDLSNQQLNELYMNLLSAFGFLLYAFGNMLNSLQQWWEDKIFQTVICSLGGILLNISSIFAIWSSYGAQIDRRSGKVLQV